MLNHFAGTFNKAVLGGQTAGDPGSVCLCLDDKHVTTI